MERTVWQVRDGEGRRKYATEEDTRRFLDAAGTLLEREACFCLVLALTGCRISEALALTAGMIEPGWISFATLKQRSRRFRSVPVPEALTRRLAALPSSPCGLLFPVHRATGYRWVKRAMRRARVDGIASCPKGLRHGFGMRAAAERVPPNLIQRWLGHASPETTAIYLDAVGPEERQFAARTWRGW